MSATCRECPGRVGNVVFLPTLFFTMLAVGRHVADNRRHVGVSAFLTLLPTSQTATFPAKLVEGGVFKMIGLTEEEQDE